jgi:NTE family protein
LLYVVDLYARDGSRPHSMEAAAERKNDLLFGNQTFIRLKYCAEMRALRKQLAHAQIDEAADEIVLLSYRPGMEEPGPEKSFEFSASAIAQRWQAGRLDMEYALQSPYEAPIKAVRRPAAAGRSKAA